MAKPILYGPGYSTYARSARLAMEEKGVDYDLVEIDFIGGGMPEEHLARHPFGKVPAFEHDGLMLYETSAIMRYVDEAFDGPSLQPSDVAGRARMTQVISVIDSYTYPRTISDLVIQRLVQPMLGGTADESIIEAAVPEVDKSMREFERMLGDHEYLVGSTLSLADLHLAPVFAYFVDTPESKAILESKPSLSAWWERIASRDSMTKTQPNLG
ncbi:MAG: glutathione S-transferase family protein [Gammaproteobacteria bacterium]|nr:glutathione S-transferase family protein [Gammaproteobacteria bacterium]NIM72730.1 glutathione S-transferase family protein [Gammaproteobacteria bacterium]NIN38187.1 glutathione S-transferase family protein [Gammaproteobacteria bacterium]NIO24478.1 glutathione S-transferase family protein [Gammaproteobacteria bacterium]NIO65087.1 glutathione S-transferase family protein [Gammaproteobacteria bacterium]